MTYSNNQFRHKTGGLWFGSYFLRHYRRCSLFGIRGTRYTMIVNGNVNGDFVDSNDLAMYMIE